MKVLVCGSRGWKDDGSVHDRMAELDADTVIVCGMASSGADYLAAVAARALGLMLIEMPAKWRTNGVYSRTAGHQRNLAMLDELPDLVLAFWDGKSSGTQHTLDNAAWRKIPIEVIYPRRRSNFGT